MTRLWLTALALAAALLAGIGRAEAPAPPEPEGYRTGVLRAPVPATLAGAAVLDLAGLEAMVARRAALIDVGPAPVRPEPLPAGTLWLPTHHSIPGAAWMPGAGLGDDLPPDRQRLLLDQVAALTHGDRSAPIVVFCRPDCWASWNVGKRLVQAGYSGVAWFPGGVDAWQIDHPTETVEPMPGWIPASVAGGG